MTPPTVYSIRDWSDHFEPGDDARNKRLSWVAVPNKHDGKGYGRLMAQADGLALFGAWCLLVQVASRCPVIGRPSDQAPLGLWRGVMRERFAAGRDAAAYGQRWQVETVNSMLKRNLGSACRATTARRQTYELLLRCITHNIMVLEGTEP